MGVREKIELLLSIVVLVATVLVYYLLVSIDYIVHNVLYQFGLQFSYEWANSYWLSLRISLVLLVLMEIAALLNVAYARTPTAEIDQDLIKWIDEEVEKRGFRDRSAAIEYAIAKLKKEK